jgi:hypothetical protein
MAHQRGITKLKGSLDDMVFYKHDGKHIVRKSTSDFMSNFVKTHENAIRIRENNNEFKTASLYASAIRKVTDRVIFNCCRSKGILKLTTTLLKAATTEDKVNVRGMREIVCEKLDGHLHNHQFGDYENFDKCFLRGVDVDENYNGNGVHRITFSRHDAANDIQYPSGATHYSFACGVMMCGNDKFDFKFTEMLQNPIGQYSQVSGLVQKAEFIINDPPGAMGNFRMFIVAIHFFKYDGNNIKPFFLGRRNAAKVALITS